MPKLTIEYGDHANGGGDKCHFTRILIDGEPMGMVQRISYTDKVGTPHPVMEIEQIIYTEKGLEIVKAFRSIPNLIYKPTFMNPAAGEEWVVVEEKDFVPTPDGEW